MSEITPIAEEVTRISVQELINETEKQLNNSKININIVIQKMDLFKNAYGDYIKQKRINKQSLKNENAILYNSNQEENKLQKIAYEKFFDFQNSFNEYFNQRIQMVFATEDLELMLINNSTEDLSRNQWNRLFYDMSKIKEKIYLEADEDYDPSSLKMTAQEVLHRWNVAISKHNGKTNHLPILWQIGKIWKKAIVNNKGTILEAYANFFINKQYFLENKESNVGHYVMDEKYGMRSVDNTSGFVVGDVQQGNNSRVQFGIKAKLASPMGMAQVYKLIIKFSENLKSAELQHQTLENIKTILSEPGTWKQVSQATEVFINSKKDELLQDMVNSY